MKKRATLYLEKDFVIKWRKFLQPMKSDIKMQLSIGKSPRSAVDYVFKKRMVREKLRNLILDMVEKALNI